MKSKSLFLLLLTLLFGGTSAVLANPLMGDIVMDGQFNDWNNGFGNEVCQIDEGGELDTGSYLSDIYGFCIGHDETSEFYVMMAGTSFALDDPPIVEYCTQIDVPPTGASTLPDGVYDYEVCYRSDGECDYSDPTAPDCLLTGEWLTVSCLSANCTGPQSLPVSNILYFVYPPDYEPFPSTMSSNLYIEIPLSFASLGLQPDDTVCATANSPLTNDPIFNNPTDSLCTTIFVGVPTAVSLSASSITTPTTNPIWITATAILLGLSAVMYRRKPN